MFIPVSVLLFLFFYSIVDDWTELWFFVCVFLFFPLIVVGLAYALFYGSLILLALISQTL